MQKGGIEMDMYLCFCVVAFHLHCVLILLMWLGILDPYFLYQFVT